MIMLNRRKYLILLSLLVPILTWGQDTLRRSSLPEINIRQIRSSVPILPTQVTYQEQMIKLGDAVLSDAVKRMSGVTLKDYGGVGGIKTVSVRGLGSQFSTLTIDGIAVTDCQNGQVDLGRYTLGNSGLISLYNGQPDSKLSSARALAAGSIVNMETAMPEFGQHPYNIGLGLEGGSFGYLAPTLAFDRQIGRHCAISFWSNYTQSEGNYPFTLYYTASRQDSCSRERRENSQVRIGTADLNFFYRPTDNEQLHIKMHYMQGYHALPGPVVFYTVRGSEHSEEQLFFGQARYKKSGKHWDVQLLGKYQQGIDIYEDTAARNAQHLIRNEYGQQEGYLSQTVRMHTGGSDNERLTLSLALDESLSHLTSNLSKHNDVERMTLLGAAGIEYQPCLLHWMRGIRLKANLLATRITDMEQGQTAAPYQKISPFVGLSWPLGQVILRYYYKDTYRVPNFNELYYFTVGRTLNPEKARQHNAGASFQGRAKALAKDMTYQHSATLDFYRNEVNDKIIAYPTNNMYLWTMKNLGEVEILGADATYSASLSGLINHQGYQAYDLGLTIGYTYQYAVDRTDPKSKFYGHQIPYTPRHSGSIALTANTPWADLGLTTMLVGRRYSLQQNTEANMVKGYVDQGVTLSRKFYLDRGWFMVKVQVLNIFDQQYEVVKNYPMMGRNYRVGLHYQF